MQYRQRGFLAGLPHQQFIQCNTIMSLSNTRVKIGFKIVLPLIYYSSLSSLSLSLSVRSPIDCYSSLSSLSVHNGAFSWFAPPAIHAIQSNHLSLSRAKKRNCQSNSKYLLLSCTLGSCFLSVARVFEMIFTITI